MRFTHRDLFFRLRSTKSHFYQQRKENLKIYDHIFITHGLTSKMI